MTKTVMIFILAFVVLSILQVIVRKLVYRKIMKLSDQEDYANFYKTIDSIPAYITLTPFERENLRVSGYIFEEKTKDVDERMDLVLKMRIKPQQKLVVINRAFYYYLDKKLEAQAKKMLDAAKECAGEAACHNLEIQYSILLKKESKYIDELIQRVEKFKSKHAELTEEQQFVVGTYEYLIGLQYSYKNDIGNMMKYFNSAMEILGDSPYCDDMQNIINSKKA